MLGGQRRTKRIAKGPRRRPRRIEIAMQAVDKKNNKNSSKLKRIICSQTFYTFLRVSHFDNLPFMPYTLHPYYSK